MNKIEKNSGGLQNNGRNDEISAVREFWERNPLFVGEGKNEVGSQAFFVEHTNMYLTDVLAGKALDNRFFDIDQKSRVLEVGCGIGFWQQQFAVRGYQNLHGVDLSYRSLELARARLSVWTSITQYSAMKL